MKNAFRAAAVAAALAFIPGAWCAVFAGTAGLYAEQLTETNYRRVINEQQVCFVVYYVGEAPGKPEMDEFVRFFKMDVPPEIPFYEIDLAPFSDPGKDILIKNDITQDAAPALVIYKRGKALDQGIGYPKKEQYEEWKAYFKKLL